MNSDKRSQIKHWWDNLNFKKQTLTGKIILIISVFVFGSFLIYNLLVISLRRWDEIGLISIWVLFGWIFFVILLYVSVKLISLIMHKEKSELEKNNNVSKKTNSNFCIWYIRKRMPVF